MTRARPNGPPVEVELPVTPMLDMTFQLLVFFIATFHPHALEGQLDFTLPSAGPAVAEPLDPEQSSSLDFELPADLTVQVRAADSGHDGAINTIAVRSQETVTQVRDLDELIEYLKHVRKSLANQADIKVAADLRLKYACVVQVMDACVQSGFPRIGFAPLAEDAGR